MDGKATTGLLGVDYGDESRLGGVALAWSDSEGGYRVSGAEVVGGYGGVAECGDSLRVVASGGAAGCVGCVGVRERDDDGDAR